MDAFVSSCNKKKKELRKWILKNIISQCLTQQVLEEKDTVLALFNDDIKDLDNKIKTIKYKDFRLRVKFMQNTSRLENMKIPSTILETVTLITQETQA